MIDLNSYLNLTSHDFKDQTPEQILKEFNSFMPGRVFTGLAPQIIDIPILRGRIWNQVGLPLTIQQCSYPPSVDYFGRCNIPGHPVFYGSEIVLPVVLDEIGARLGDYIIIGRWDFKVTQEIKIAPFIYGVNISHESIKLYQQQMDLHIQSMYSDNPSAAESYKLHLKVFNNLFVLNNYKLSGTIAHNMIYENKILMDTFHCLMYSSIASHHSGINFAIDKSLCDNKKVQPKRFYLLRYIETKSVEKGYYVLIPSFVGYPDLITDKIVWEEFEITKHENIMFQDTHFKSRE